MRKTGFTIVEFLISITILCIVVASIVPVAFKKNHEIIEMIKNDGTFRCGCEMEEKDGGLFCDFFPNNDNGKKARNQEFFTMIVTGGGAGAYSDGATLEENAYRFGGNAGESKTLSFPSLGNDSYRIYLGQGGNIGQNGGSTMVYRYAKTTGDDGSEQTKLELFAYARGGMVNKNTFSTGDANFSAVTGDTLEERKLTVLANLVGKIPVDATLITTGERYVGRYCGQGGDQANVATIDANYYSNGIKASTQGTPGEVIIKW